MHQFAGLRPYWKVAAAGLILASIILAGPLLVAGQEDPPCEILLIEGFDLLFDSRTEQVYVTEPSTRTIYALSLPSLEVAVEKQFEVPPLHMALSPIDNVIFVGFESSVVLLLRPDTLDTIGMVELASTPSHLAADAWGRLFVAFAQGEAPAVVDVVNRTIAGRLEAENSDRNSLLLVSSDSSQLYQGLIGGGTVEVLRYELTAEGVQFVLALFQRPAGDLRDMALTSDGRRLYLAQDQPDRVQVLDALSFQVEGGLMTRASPSGIALAEGEGRVYATHRSNDIHAFRDDAFREEGAYFTSPYDPTLLVYSEKHRMIVAKASLFGGGEVNVLLGLSTQQAFGVAGCPQGHPLRSYGFADRGFEVGLPHGWDIQTDYTVEGIGTADVIAFGPVRYGFRTNILVASESGSVRESTEFLFDVANETIREISSNTSITVQQPPKLFNLGDSVTVLFEISRDGTQIHQVIAVVADSSRGKLYAIVGSADRRFIGSFRETFDFVVGSFRVLPLSPWWSFFTTPLGYSVLAAVAAGAAVGVGVLARRRRSQRQAPSPAPTHSEARDAYVEPITLEGVQREGESFLEACPHCGSPLQPPRRFCSVCGARL